MPLLGSAAMMLSFDIDPVALVEHDHWHTREHLPERLSIPGFRRGTRWTALDGGSPRCMVLYEVQSLDTLVSEAYLTRLNHPSPWTQRMMPHYRGMSRGLCSVVGSLGLGLGGVAALLRFTPDPLQACPLTHWLLQEALPAVPDTPGLGSAHLLQGAQVATMTNEQRSRGADRGVDAALIVTGYDVDAVAGFVTSMQGAGGLASRGAGALSAALYRLSHSLAAAELAA